MSEIQTSNWSETAANNNQTPPNGWPEGQAPSTVNDCAREMMAAVRRWFGRWHGIDESEALIASGGTSTVITVTYSNAPASLFTGLEVGFKVTTTCGADPTLNVNSLGAKNIQKLVGSGYVNLEANDLIATQHVKVKYDGTLDKWVMLTPRLWDSTDQITWYDDFLGDSLDAKYQTRVGSDAACLVSVSGGVPHGRALLRTGAGAGATLAVNGALLDFGNVFARATDGIMEMEFRLQLSAITNVALFVGWTDTVSALEMPFTLGAGDALTSDASDAVGILFDTAADTDNWWLVGVKADVDATKQNTAVAPVAATMERWRIEVSAAGTATFYRNGAAIGTAMTNAVSTGVILTPVIVGFARAAAGRDVSLDYWRVAAFRD